MLAVCGKCGALLLEGVCSVCSVAVKTTRLGIGFKHMPTACNEVDRRKGREMLREMKKAGMDMHALAAGASVSIDCANRWLHYGQDPGPRGLEKLSAYYQDWKQKLETPDAV